MFQIILWKVGRHLQRTVHRNIKRKLTADGRVYVRTTCAVHFEDARRVIHRPTLQTSEWQYGRMPWFCAPEGLILGAACALVADKVGVSAAQTRGANRLVRVNHNLIIGCTFHGLQVMVHHHLSIVILATRNDVANISAFHRVISVEVHQLVGTVHVTFVVHHRRRRFMVHH